MEQFGLQLPLEPIDDLRNGRRCRPAVSGRGAERAGLDSANKREDAGRAIRFLHRLPGLAVSNCLRLGRAARPRPGPLRKRRATRSEEHTSELQSLMRTSDAIFCLKKKKQHPT